MVSHHAIPSVKPPVAASHLVWFGVTSAYLLGQLDIPRCECLCSVVAIALGTKPWELRFEPTSGQNYFFPVFSSKHTFELCKTILMSS